MLGLEGKVKRSQTCDDNGVAVGLAPQLKEVYNIAKTQRRMTSEDDTGSLHILIE